MNNINYGEEFKKQAYEGIHREYLKQLGISSYLMKTSKFMDALSNFEDSMEYTYYKTWEKGYERYLVDHGYSTSDIGPDDQLHWWYDDIKQDFVFYIEGPITHNKHLQDANRLRIPSPFTPQEMEDIANGTLNRIGDDIVELQKKMEEKRRTMGESFLVHAAPGTMIEDSIVRNPNNGTLEQHKKILDPVNNMVTTVSVEVIEEPEPEVWGAETYDDTVRFTVTPIQSSSIQRGFEAQAKDALDRANYEIIGTQMKDSLTYDDTVRFTVTPMKKEDDIHATMNDDERKKQEVEKMNERDLKDSGTRREFDTGAIRDAETGKGRCDLLPACAILRLARHYEAGARKYAARNWEKGMPISVMIDSGMRHLLKYLDGQNDEDHLVAACWNLMGAMWMEEKHPEQQDILTRPEGRSRDDHA